MSAVLAEVDRLAEVVCLILDGRTGPSVEEIVEAAKSGAVTEEQAIAALERDYAESARHKQWREVPMADTIDLYATNPTSAADETMYREQAERLLLAVINDLPINQRRAVELYYFENQSQEEIGRRLRISQPAVSARIAAARARIVSSVGKMVVKVPTSAVNIGPTVNLNLLMRAPTGKQKRHHPPIYPYELWKRYNAGAEWSGNGVYATRYEDKLRDYLKACFGDAPLRIAIPRGL